MGVVLSLLGQNGRADCAIKKERNEKTKKQFQGNGVNELRGGERRLVGAILTLGCGHVKNSVFCNIGVDVTV